MPKRSITSLILLCFFLSSSTVLTAQKVTESFNITVERTAREIRLTCTEGCFWSELTYRNDESAQAINRSGMVALPDDSAGFDDTKEGFLFTLAKTPQGLSLQGLRGTAWETLNFSLAAGQSITVNALGMTEK